MISRKTIEYARTVALSLAHARTRRQRQKLAVYNRCFKRIVWSLQEGMSEQLKSMSSGVCPYCGKRYKNIKKHISLSLACSKSLLHDVKRVLEEIWYPNKTW